MKQYLRMVTARLNSLPATKILVLQSTYADTTLGHLLEQIAMTRHNVPIGIVCHPSILQPLLLRFACEDMQRHAVEILD